MFLALATSRGKALIDRQLYLPKSWSGDAVRRREAGVPEDVRFATKPQLAVAMLRRVLDAALRPRWVLADAVYGSDSKTRRFLESRGQPYVMAVTSQQRLWVNFKQQRVDTIINEVPEDQWQTHRIAQGSKGERVYQWTAGKFGIPIEHQRGNLQPWLLVRGNVGLWKPSFQMAKQEVGLDAYEVRSWTGWHRHVTLSMLALAFLSAVRAQVCEPTKKGAVIWSR